MVFSVCSFCFVLFLISHVWHHFKSGIFYLSLILQNLSQYLFKYFLYFFFLFCCIWAEVINLFVFPNSFIHFTAIFILVSIYCILYFNNFHLIYIHSIVSFFSLYMYIIILSYTFKLFLKIFYLFIWQWEITSRQRGGQRERKRSRLPAEQKARCGAWSQDPEIMTWTEGSGLTHWATQALLLSYFLKVQSFFFF